MTTDTPVRDTRTLEEKQRDFFEALAGGADLIAHPDTIENVATTQPEFWRSLGELVTRSGGKVWPNRYLDPNGRQLLAVKARPFDFAPNFNFGGKHDRHSRTE